MEKPTIVLKLKAKHFSRLYALAARVHDHLNANIHFAAPVISLPVLEAGIVELADAIAKWGSRSNRGSHLDYVNLKSAAINLYAMLKTLAIYCEQTVMLNVPAGEQESAMASSGFALKKQKTPQGRLEMVQNFHHFIARNIRQGEVKMRWEMPLNVTTHTNVRCYDIFRNASNDFATAKNIKSVSAATYTDAPDAGTWFYWVVPVNYMGYGVTSHALMITIG